MMSAREEKYNFIAKKSEIKRVDFVRQIYEKAKKHLEQRTMQYVIQVTDLRTNPLQEGENDMILAKECNQVLIGPITRLSVKRFKEALNGLI